MGAYLLISIILFSSILIFQYKNEPSLLNFLSNNWGALHLYKMRIFNLSFISKHSYFLLSIYTASHTISTSIVTLILLFSTLLTLFLPFLSKLIKSSKAVNSTIVSNLLDIAPSSIPHGWYMYFYYNHHFLSKNKP